jgi:hypothetical protein
MSAQRRRSDTMSPVSLPTRITIDFRDSVHPSRTWILGLEDETAVRVDLLAFDAPMPPSLRGGTATAVASPPPVALRALSAECACPDFCERDHGNE